jgi:uncharacterized protein YdhG (YjbR/CyaY superfamily)
MSNLCQPLAGTISVQNESPNRVNELYNTCYCRMVEELWEHFFPVAVSLRQQPVKLKKNTMDLSPKKTFTTIDQYHAFYPAPVRAKMETLRQAIVQAAPKAQEVISYNMPAFRQNGVLVYYAANKAHIGFYPTPTPIQVFKDALKDYVTSKGAIQFPLDKAIPITLVKKIVKLRVLEDQEKAAAKKKKTAKKSTKKAVKKKKA